MPRVPSAAPAVVVVAVVVAGALALPVAAHSNHANADSQVSTDGAVVVESAFASTDAHLVVHRVTADGEPSEPIGSVPYPASRGYGTAVEVPVDDAVWSDWETQQVYVVLHRDDGSDAFDPEEDPPLLFYDGIAGERITLAKGSTANVVAQGFGPSRLADGRVTVRHAELGTDGFLVVRTRDGDEAGRVVGHTALPAGTHADVAVELNESYLAAHGNRSEFDLYATVYRDDGDGSFDPATDAPATAGDERVRSAFTAVRGGGNATATTDDAPAVNTPTPTTDGASATTTGASTGTTTPGTTGATGPGFTALAALAVLVAGALVGVLAAGRWR